MIFNHFTLYIFRFDITQEGRKRRLIFKNSKLSDEGQYTCKTNADTTTAELIVERKYFLYLYL